MKINKRVTLVCLVFISLGGLFGGIGFIVKPDGSLLHSSLTLLKHAPVKNYRWPGVFLLLFMGVWPAINLFGMIKGKSWAGKSNFVFGGLSILWLIYEIIIIRTFSPLQPLIALIGLYLFLTNIPVHD